MMVLQAKLLERRRQEDQAKNGRPSRTPARSWGNQMRSYVLHPYQMVKDLRTEHEVGNPSAVLDGDIDGFIEGGHPLAPPAAGRARPVSHTASCPAVPVTSAP